VIRTDKIGNEKTLVTQLEQKKEKSNNEDENNPLAVFLYALRAPETRRQYPRRAKVFFDFLKLEEPLEKQAKDFLSKARQNPQWAQFSLMQFIAFQKERAKDGKISYSTISNYYKAIKLFVEMNTDYPIINWKKIAKGLPAVRKAANDRAPTLEELRKLSEYPDRRIKTLVYIMASSGIRIGAWDYLKWKNIFPMTDVKTGNVVAARLVVYAGEPDEYYCFITPEAYNSAKQWMKYREQYGEKITGDSWIMRDLWQTTTTNYGAKFGVATFPKKLKSSGIKSLLERAIKAQGLWKPLALGKTRREWKGAHGYRKYYKSHAEQVMKPINVELTMGHDIGISASYYKPTENEVLEDYCKAVNLLTVNEDKVILQKKIDGLKEKSENSAILIEAKLSAKEKEIELLRQKDSVNTDAISTLSDRLTKVIQEIEEMKKRK
jgi:hypothetical protein